MVIHDKWPVEHDAKSLVFEEVAHYLHNLLASRYCSSASLQRVSGMFRLVGVNAAVALRYIQFRWSAPLLRRTLGQSAKQHIMADALRRAASGRYANEMAAAASAVERLQPDEDADRTTTDTCGGKGAAMTDIERLWRLFLEHSTLQNFDRIYPVVSDQFGPLNCDGVSVRGCQPSKK